MTRREASAWFVALVAAGMAISIYLESRPAPPTEQAVAHERTAVATTTSARTDTVFAHDTIRLSEGRRTFRAARDTLFLHITDTLLVKAALIAADTIIALDSVALASATRAIVAHQAVESALRNELALALVPRPAPRFTLIGAALYDPIHVTPAASIDATIRVIGRASLLARADQRFRPGEQPGLSVGISVRL